MGNTQVWTLIRQGGTRLGLALVVIASVSCGRLNSDTGTSPSYLYVESLVGASGAKSDEFGGTLASDVLTLVKRQVGTETVYTPTIYEDIGKVTLKLALKDVTGASPTASNAITVTRYRVVYRRADGRNTQGVDVPYAFDGAATGTITSNGSTISFVIVRAQAKLEAPLMALANSGGQIHIATIADITFYGRDQNGNDATVTGSISITFADWGDPE